MPIRPRSSVVAMGCLVLCAMSWPASADDGPTLYKQLCASCHDTGLARAPTRDVLQVMTPERVLTAKARAERPLLGGVVQRHLRLEHVAEGQGEPHDDLLPQQRPGGAIETGALVKATSAALARSE